MMKEKPSVQQPGGVLDGGEPEPALNLLEPVKWPRRGLHNFPLTQSVHKAGLI